MMAAAELKFSNEAKLRKQMRRRGITEEMILDALEQEPAERKGKLGPARLYRSPTSGIHVLVDAATDAIFHVGNRGTDMTMREVHVALLDEGIPVWRPTQALPVDGDTFVLLRPDDYDPEDETWEFPPGSLVRCQPRTIADGEIFAATHLVKLDIRQSA